MNSRKNLTFVSPRFLFPTDSGGKIRTTQILRGLKNGAFQVTLVMPTSGRERLHYAEQIRAVCDDLVPWEPKQQIRLWKYVKKLSSVFHSNPISVRSDWDAAGAQTVQRALERKPDVVVFDFPHSAILAPEEIHVPSVMFTHNIEAEIFQRHWQVARFLPHRLMWRDQYRKMRRFEKIELSKFNTVIAVSERDSSFFNDEYQIEHCRTIPTGVDTEFFAYETPENDLQVVFCGSMDWMANVDGIEFFYDKVWPLIREKAPAARMKVVGRTPPERLVKRIGAVAPEWEFTGYVDDVRTHICGSAAFVIPLRVGGGTRIKAFEAMAMGVPVVSTSIGIEGLPVKHGEHYLVADAAVAFAENVVALLSDSQMRTKISRSARRLVEERYGYQHAARVFQEICLDTIAQRSEQ